ncbi:hypothetical protein DV736_g524, partial [Chaetothyriales sp. CBS 134916]
MVKFRGIEISIISQFDIRSLPEFRYRQTASPCGRQLDSVQSAIVSCYVPIYPGSQIWVEYGIDGPHPPNALYFFKILFNERVITSFGCGRENSYRGKMMYNLIAQGQDSLLGGIPIVRQALFFCSEIEDRPGRKEDIIEVRIHRVEHRKRIRQLQDGEGGASTQWCPQETLQLVDGGLLEHGFPRRRYKYQLVDAVDEPYATFKFFCRSHEYLRSHGVIDSLAGSHSGSVCSENWYEDSNAVDSAPLDGEGESAGMPPNTTVGTPSSAANRVSSLSMMDEHRSVLSGTYLPPTDSDEDLSILTRDSIEGLPSTVPRSPRSPAKDKDVPNPTYAAADPVRSSPRRRLKTRLTLNLNGAEFDLETKNRLSRPFTRGGMFRKLVPPSAPAAVTEFGPTIQDELEESLGRRSQGSMGEEMLTARTTRAERGGKSLMGFLSRRVAAK